MLRDACPPSSGIVERVSEITWTAGSALSAEDKVQGMGRLEVTMRRGDGRAAMLRWE
jgi:hypothetical protein